MLKTLNTLRLVIYMFLLNTGYIIMWLNFIKKHPKKVYCLDVNGSAFEAVAV